MASKTKAETKTEYVVLFYDPQGGDDRHATRLNPNGGYEAYEAARRSAKRKGRTVRLERQELYRNDWGDWEVGDTEIIEGDGGED